MRYIYNLNTHWMIFKNHHNQHYRWISQLFSFPLLSANFTPHFSLLWYIMVYKKERCLKQTLISNFTHKPYNKVVNISIIYFVTNNKCSLESTWIRTQLRPLQARWRTSFERRHSQVVLTDPAVMNRIFHSEMEVTARAGGACTQFKTKHQSKHQLVLPANMALH